MRRHRPPARRDRLGLRAEPALALVRFDPDLRVPGAPGHVVDAAVLGDVALDGAAPGRVGLGAGPAPGAELPGRLRGALPDAEALGFREGLLLHVAGRVFDEGPGVALPHHLRIDVAAVDEAGCERAPVLVEAVGLASDGLVADHAGEGGGRCGAARPRSEPFALAGL